MRSLTDASCAEDFSFGHAQAFFKNLGTEATFLLLAETGKYALSDFTDTLKPADFSVQQFVDIVRFIGGAEIAKRVIQGTITPNKIDRGIALVTKEQTLFDHRGRRIPIGLNSNVCDPSPDQWVRENPDNWSEQCDYLALFNKVGIHSDGIMKFHHLMRRQERFLKEKLSNDAKTANILEGVCLPLMIPQLTVNEDYTSVLFTHYLDCMKKILKVRQMPPFQDFSYDPTREGVRMSIAPGSRYDELLWRLRNNSVPVLYFPNALLGFSRKACWEQMSTLPQGFCIAGGIETFMAVGTYADCMFQPGLHNTQITGGVFWDFPQNHYGYTCSEVGITRFSDCTQIQLHDKSRSPVDSPHGSRTCGLVYFGS